VEQTSIRITEQAGERLDHAVHAALPQLSRTAVQRLIDGGHVRVDGHPARPG
jgi:23S rRNA pseudouridine1911/1915/1917 synthase